MAGAMNDPYTELESIFARFIDGDRANTEKEILALLVSQGIGVRRDDGRPKQLTVSKPTSINNALVIGLRYTKRDGTQTEDHFLFQQGCQVERHYGRSLEKKLPEYRGTHKQQVLFTCVVATPTLVTSVNTITMWSRAIGKANEW